jgi:hypothetical protein
MICLQCNTGSTGKLAGAPEISTSGMGSKKKDALVKSWLKSYHCPPAPALIRSPWSIRSHKMSSHENGSLQELLRGVVTPGLKKMPLPRRGAPAADHNAEINMFRVSWPGCEPDRLLGGSPEQKERFHRCVASGSPSIPVNSRVLQREVVSPVPPRKGMKNIVVLPCRYGRMSAWFNGWGSDWMNCCWRVCLLTNCHYK